MGYEKHYVPLESDPAIFTELMHGLGVSDRLEFIDVLSIQDEELLGMIPRPVLALIVIFPEEDTARTIDSSSKTCLPCREYPNEMMWFEQTIDNACGLYAILHAVSNGAATGFVQSDSILQSVLDRCRLVDPSDRTKVIHDSEPLIRARYEKAALQGSTEPPDATAEVACHYVCFTKSSEGILWLLDGTRNGPIKYDIISGPSEDVLEGVALSQVRKFIEENSMGGGLNLGMMALTLTSR